MTSTPEDNSSSPGRMDDEEEDSLSDEFDRGVFGVTGAVEDAE